MIYLISDLHLSATETDIFYRFEQFTARLVSGDQLYILGDLFEYWLGDDAVFFLDHENTFNLLRILTERQVKIFFMAGNRDFLVGETFSEECGVTLLTDEHILEIDSRKVLLMHGDSLCTDDIPHQNFRAMVLDDAWQKGFLSKSIAERDQLVRLARYRSDDTKTDKSMEIMDVTDAAVSAVVTKHSVRLLIHGHTHRPAIHSINCQLPNCHRIVLGDWASGESWITLTKDEILLHHHGKTDQLIL